MKRILSVQDISCIGRCSQTVALPVISAMGCRCDILPTAILSTHTGFPQPYRRSLTADIAPIAAHWKAIGAEFDAVLVGYLADTPQALAVKDLLDSFSARRIIDPAMGDHGKLYSGRTEDQLRAIADLCRDADVVLPNITEAAFLTGLPYRETADRAYYDELIDALLDLGAKNVLLTSAGAEGATGFYGRYNGEGFSYTAPLQPGSHGTGDLFAAAFTAAFARWENIPAAGKLAAEFVERCLAATKQRTPYGVEFERVLPWLTAQSKLFA